MPVMKVRSSLQAKRDVASILLYTEQHWGTVQRQRYRVMLRESFTVIGENPFLGTPIHPSSPEFRRHPVDEHVVFYRVHENFIEIVRVLHYRMDTSLLIGE